MTKYDLFRRRIAPIAFGVAIALLARESCQKQQRAKATFILDFGAAAPKVHAVDAEVWMNGESISQFHRAALGGSIGPTQFTGSLPATDGELRIDVDLGGGDHRHVVRTVHVEDGATATVPLERDLR